MMPRSGFLRGGRRAERDREQRERERAAEKQARLQALLAGGYERRSATYGGTTAGPVPKDEPAKPGKRAPTVEERRWMDFIVEYGCIACRIDGNPPRPTTVHHILRGGVRMGHMHSLGLCDPGHHQGGGPLGLVSRHPDKARFEAQYGTEQELLQMLRLEYARA